MSSSSVILPDVSIRKSESKMVYLERWWSRVRAADICETESLLPVLDGTPICSKICVCIYVGVFDQHTMRHSIDTYIYTQYAILLQKEFGSWMEKSQTIYQYNQWQNCFGQLLFKPPLNLNNVVGLVNNILCHNFPLRFNIVRGAWGGGGQIFCSVVQFDILSRVFCHRL